MELEKRFKTTKELAVITEKQSSVPVPRNVPAYRAYIDWLATPQELREPLLKKDFCAKWGVSEACPKRWSKRPDFYMALERRIRAWGKEQTPDVIRALHKKILKTGNAHEARLWLEWIQDWDDAQKPQPAVNVNIFDKGNWEAFVSAFHERKRKNVGGHATKTGP